MSDEIKECPKCTEAQVAIGGLSRKILEFSPPPAQEDLDDAIERELSIARADLATLKAKNKQACDMLNETIAEAATLRAKLERAEKELDEIALATGYGERPEGQGHVIRASGEEIARKFKDVCAENVRLADEWAETHEWNNTLLSEHHAAIAAREKAEARADTAQIKAINLQEENTRLKSELDGYDHQELALEARAEKAEAGAAEYRQALELQDPRNATECFERMAADFRRKTGLMAPGKDVAAAMSYSDEDEEKRRALWRPFVNEWHEAFFDKALSSDAGSALLAELRKLRENETNHVQAMLLTVNEARDKEREECARLVETWAQDNETIQPSFAGIALAIRSRSGRVKP